MLIITIQNDKTGTLKNRNYNYSVYVNTQKLATGRVEGHDPSKGWQGLITQLADTVDTATPANTLDDRLLQFIKRLK